MGKQVHIYGMIGLMAGFAVLFPMGVGQAVGFADLGEPVEDSDILREMRGQKPLGETRTADAGNASETGKKKDEAQRAAEAKEMEAKQKQAEAEAKIAEAKQQQAEAEAKIAEAEAKTAEARKRQAEAEAKAAEAERLVGMQVKEAEAQDLGVQKPKQEAQGAEAKEPSAESEKELAKRKIEANRRPAEDRKRAIEESQREAEENRKAAEDGRMRFLPIIRDENFAYYLDMESVRWIRVPYAASEYMIDAWIRLVDKKDAWNFAPAATRNPEKYYMEHYYIRPKKRQIQFLCELEVMGKPQNTISEREYSAKNWENLIPGSIESDIYYAVLKETQDHSDGNMTFADMLDEYLRIGLN